MTTAYYGEFEPDWRLKHCVACYWGFRVPARLDDQGRWHEIGEMSGKDGEWRQFFEMTLTKS